MVFQLFRDQYESQTVSRKVQQTRGVTCACACARDVPYMSSYRYKNRTVPPHLSLRYALLDAEEGGSEELQDVPASAHRYSRPVVRTFHIDALLFGNRAEERLKVS